MDSANSTHVLSVHEFPEGLMLLGDWKRMHLAYLLGHTTQRRPLTQAVVHRMNHLHISRIRWYKAMPSTPPSHPRTFEVASGSHWEAAPAVVVGPDATRVAQIALPVQHQHHHLVAEVSLPVSSEGASAQVGAATAVQGYLRIEGNCGPLFADFRRTSSSTNASHSSGNGRPSRLTAGMIGLRGFNNTSFNDPASPSASPSLLNTVDSTPIPRRRSTSTLETPTAPHADNRGYQDSPITAIKGSFNDEVIASPVQEGPSWLRDSDFDDEPDTDVDESLDAVPARLDFSYLNRRSYSGSAGSSSPFISPFASRSSSVASRSRGSRGSTDTNRSVGTRPNSRSNSSNATSFSTSSSFSLSSAGLTFSDNPLNRITGMAAAEVETRFLVSYPGPQFDGFESSQPQSPFQTRFDDTDEECISELSFPAPLQTAASSTPAADRPRGFLTLRDLTILADLVERSLKKENDASHLHPDDASDSGASDVSGETDPMDMPIPVQHTASTCCCEFYRRLFDLIPLVSGLLPSAGGGDGGSEELSPLMSALTLDDSELGPQNHHEYYAHHGRYLRTPFGIQGEGEGDGGEQSNAAIQERLRARFERRRSRFEEDLVHIVRSDSFFTGSVRPSTETAYSTSATVPASALDEARIADERFQRAVRQPQETSSRS